MTTLLFANNASTTLAQNITGLSQTIYLAAGTGAEFPSPTTGQAFYATIYNSSNTVYEIVLVTNRNGDVLTVQRAQEGTTAQTWLVGNTIGMYPTAATMEKLIQNDQLQAGKYTIAQAAGTANALTCAINSDLTAIPDGMTLVLKPVYANTGAATLQVTMGSTLLPSVPIVKGSNLAIEANDIPSAGYPVQLIYSSIFGAWVMQMPSTLISPPTPPTYQIDYLIISGGAGGGYGQGGGGGGGGYIYNNFTALTGTVFTIAVGGGGATDTSGGSSYITGIATGTGGGAGGHGGNPAVAGAIGGSGGGGGGGFQDGTPGAAGGGALQGYAGGGGGTAGGGLPGGGGGGGGAGQAGLGASGSVGGNGGAGTINTITGIAITYAGGGGGGGGWYGGGSSGGAGGGGYGGYNNYGTTSAAGNGIAYTGGGGGGGAPFNLPGGNGGSGVVIFSMPTTRYSGNTTGLPTITTNGSKTILKYTNSGSYTA